MVIRILVLSALLISFLPQLSSAKSSEHCCKSCRAPDLPAQQSAQNCSCCKPKHDFGSNPSFPITAKKLVEVWEDSSPGERIEDFAGSWVTVAWMNQTRLGSLELSNSASQRNERGNLIGSHYYFALACGKEWRRTRISRVNSFGLVQADCEEDKPVMMADNGLYEFYSPLQNISFTTVCRFVRPIHFVSFHELNPKLPLGEEKAMIVCEKRKVKDGREEFREIIVRSRIAQDEFEAESSEIDAGLNAAR